MTYSVKQLGERFHVGEHTVLGWIKTGELQAINVARSLGGKPHWRITAEAVQAFELLRTAMPVIEQPRRRRRRPATNLIEFY